MDKLNYNAEVKELISETRLQKYFIYPFTLCVIFDLISLYTGSFSLQQIIKPICMSLIIVYFHNFQNKQMDLFGFFISLAQYFSLIGDIALLYSDSNTNSGQNFLIGGILFFASAHVCYIISFAKNIRDSQEKVRKEIFLLFLIPVVGLLSLVYCNIYPYLGNFARPVTIYMLIISLMGYLSQVRIFYTGHLSGLYGMIGAYLFMISDALISFNIFMGLNSAMLRISIHATYFFGQYLLCQASIYHVKWNVWESEWKNIVEGNKKGQ